MSKQTFTANAVFVFEDEEMGTVGISLGEVEEDDTPLHYLLLQEDDVSYVGGEEIEGKSLYAELDDQSNACWNGVEQIELRRDSITLHFLPQAKMQNTAPDAEHPLTELTVTFDISSEEYNNLLAGLTRVTTNTCPLIEVAS